MLYWKIIGFFPFYRKVLEEKLGEIGDQDEQLEFRVNQLTTAEKKIIMLSAEVEQLKAEIERLESQGTNLRTNVSKLDHDKDVLNVSKILSLFYCLALNHCQ